MPPQNASKRRRYRFGEFLLDPAARELRYRGEPLTPSMKVFDCIAYLIENRDRAVGHDELAAAVWGRADITDVQLRQLIRQVRRVVQDDGDRQDIIRTIPYFGCHWVANIDGEDVPDPRSPMLSGAVSSELAAPAQPNDMSARRAPPSSKSVSTLTRNSVLMSIALFITLTLASGTYAWLHQPDSAPGAKSGNHASVHQPSDAIGVLPVDLGTGTDGDSSWMRLGLMDMVARHLRRATLTVVPSSDIVALDRDERTDAALAERVRVATGARELVMPSVTRPRDGWNVRLDLHRSDGTLRTVEAQSSDAAVAARDASDLLLGLFGKAPSTEYAAEHSPSTAQLLQRVEAAMLVDDFNGANRLIAAAPSTMRELPELQLDLARIDVATYHRESARERLVKLLNTLPAENDAVLRGRALTSLGMTYYDQPSLAVPRFSEAIALLENLDEPAHLGAAYNNRGIVQANERHYDEARADYARARTAYSLANDTLGLARIDNNEAILDSLRGHPAEALPLFERAAQTLERFGALEKLGSALINQISANLELLQTDDAVEVYEQAEVRLKRLEDQETLRIVRHQGAESLAAAGRLREARRLLDGIQQGADPAQEKFVLAITCRLQAQLDLAAGHSDSAIALASRTIDILSTVPRSASESAAAWLTLARALRNAHRDGEAKLQLQRFSSWGKDVSAPTTILRIRLAEAEQAWSDGDRALAVQRHEEALHTAIEKGSSSDLAEVTLSYGNALLDAGELVRASTVVGRIGRWATRDFYLALLQARLYQALGQPEAWQSALDSAHALAGERLIPTEIAMPPHRVAALAERH